MEGVRTTPSVVALTDGGERLVGQVAKRQGVTNPKNTIFAVKRLIGRDYDDKLIQDAQKVLPYKLVKDDKGAAWVEFGEEKKSPQEISAMILGKMKQTVITVPAYFNDAQRQATKDAGKISGLNVQRSTNGDTYLGGEDFDMKIAKHLQIKLTRVKLEQLCSDLIGRLIDPCKTALKDAGVSASEIDDIILVGGMTRMPAVQEKVKEIFGKEASKNADNQPAVSVHVLQGEREMAETNMTLGRFELVGIPPAPRGVPQVEVTFDIDGNGIVAVSAKDLGTGKEQSIQITASSGLSDDEIDKMVKDAEEHADEDKQKKEVVEARNQLDGLVYSAEKTLNELGDKIEEDERTKATEAIANAKKALEENDLEQIKSAQEALTTASHKLSEEMYKKAASEAGQAAPNGDASSNGDSASSNGDQQSASSDEDVVDADFEEVKE
ncbi:UNVERIFIED_CONTAM: hypothetical protein GTU68_020652 [Idotea baltica]|nr:hypothetical protein [Idotea baltica]